MKFITSNSKKIIEQMEESNQEQRETLLKLFSKKVIGHIMLMNFTIPTDAIKNFNEHGNLNEVKEIFEPT